jgi:NAD(P)-dependent dehydrogenase (short-subunit alcohol dehydrogenase family)
MEQTLKIALVTGASRGIGAAMAEALADTHHVIAVARTTGGLEELDDRIQARGGQATLAPMDVSNPDAMAHLCRSIYDRWGKIDTWVHSAVFAQMLSPAAYLDAKDWAKSVLINVTTPGQLIPMITPLLAESDAGRAIFFDDAHTGEKFFGAYGSTKAAQIALARSWQAECQTTGPKVHILSPNPMPTATRARFHPGEDRARLADPMDETIRLLASIS